MCRRFLPLILEKKSCSWKGRSPGCLYQGSKIVSLIIFHKKSSGDWHITDALKLHRFEVSGCLATVRDPSVTISNKDWGTELTGLGLVYEERH